MTIKLNPGTTVVVTGALPFSRKAFVNACARATIKVMPRVTADTAYLIVGKNPGENKVTAANRYFTPVINSHEFLAALAAWDPTLDDFFLEHGLEL